MSEIERQLWCCWRSTWQITLDISYISQWTWKDLVYSSPVRDIRHILLVDRKYSSQTVTRKEDAAGHSYGFIVRNTDISTLRWAMNTDQWLLLLYIFVQCVCVSVHSTSITRQTTNKKRKPVKERALEKKANRAKHGGAISFSSACWLSIRR